MKSETEQKTHKATAFLAKTTVNTGAPKLSINRLLIENKQKTIRVAFSIDEGSGCQRFHIGQLPLQAALINGLKPYDNKFLYSDLLECSEPDGVELELTEYPSVARAWYNKKIREYLSDKAYLMQSNYLNDTVFWLYESTADGYATFGKYTLKVTWDKQSGRLSLMVSWSGSSKILTTSVGNITEGGNLDPDIFGKVVFNKLIYNFKKLHEGGVQEIGKVFPVLNQKLTSAMCIENFPHLDRFSYKNDIQRIEKFYDNYLNNADFRKIVPIVEYWQRVPSSDIDQLSKPVIDLEFGGNEKGTDVYTMLKKHGPFKPIPSSSITAFFIFHEEDEQLVSLIKSKLADEEGSGGLNNYMKTLVFFNNDLNIVIRNDQNPGTEVEDAIRNLSLKPDTKYVAFHLSKFSRFGSSPEDNAVYYKIKQALISRGIPVQTLDKKKVSQSGKNFTLWIPNLASAVIAKLGGIPWKPVTEAFNELVVGFGLYTSHKYNRKYTGASVCFTNDGRFLEFDAFPSDEPWQMAATVEKAIKKYIATYKSARRLVIHYYKIPSKRDFDQFERMLEKLDVSIPVIIVKVTANKSNPYYVRDHNSINHIAINGTYVELFRNNYLLFLNDRQKIEENGSSAPNPIRIGLYCKDKEILSDQNTVKEVLQQLNDFCCMHWRSMKQKPYPVTIVYSTMLAEMTSFFTNEPLPMEVRRLLWFI